MVATVMVSFLASLLLLLLVPGTAAAQIPLAGTVVDPSGAPVPDATVRVETATATVAEFITARDGRFDVAVSPADLLRVVVTAAGFSQATHVLTPGSRVVEITLQPAPFFEAVNVTSSRSDVPRGDPSLTVTVISSAQLLTSAAVTIDDALKMVPGFMLFRRTSSRTANPTAQGVALRGIGGTAQSRSLVLADGVPLNDAFGGWVYWNKIPQAAIDRIEVQRGSGSDLYGADAVGGVVQLLTRRPTQPSARALIEGGNLGTGRVSLFGGGRAQGWRYSGGGEWFAIDGYIPIAEQQDPGIAPRGPIDSLLGSRHRSAMASSGYQGANGWRADLSANAYTENRTNATPAAINGTASRQGAVEVAGALGGGLLTARGFGGTQQYRQVFVTVNATRTAEAVNRDQRILTTFGGAGAQWFRERGRHMLLAGAEARYIEGRADEVPYVQGRAQPAVAPGGTQRLGSAFLQDTMRISERLTVVIGAHGDGWQSNSRLTGFEKSSGSFNPRLSAAYRAGESGVTVRGALYRGFRAPTLSEFYRNFSAGNTQTRPNEALNPERLIGGDAGVAFSRGRTSARVTAFANVLRDAITAKTLSATPQLILRERANADTLRATGLEVETTVRLPSSVSVAFAGGFMRSIFTSDTTLRGKRVPQVPGYNLGLDLRHTPGPWTTSAQLRVTGAQFEDDQNLLTLRRATVLDVFVSRTIARRISTFVAAENLFDAVYDVGRTPTLTTGLPRAMRAGVVVTLP